MSLVRFSVSLDKRVLDEFDRLIKKKGYPTRSKAITDLIREKLVSEEIKVEDKDVVGVITLVYNHHKRELVNRLVDIQHDFNELIIASQHVHLDHDNCFEVILVKGNLRRISELANRLKATKGVKHGSLHVEAVCGHIL